MLTYGVYLLHILVILLHNWLKFDTHRHCVHNVCVFVIVTSFSLSVVFTVTVSVGLPISQCSIISN